jgi:twinkle protein
MQANRGQTVDNKAASVLAQSKPGLYDISGSANFANKADFGIVVHRDLKTGRTTISVRKCRFKHLGKIGEAELEYDVPTGCYRPYRKAGLS